MLLASLPKQIFLLIFNTVILHLLADITRTQRKNGTVEHAEKIWTRNVAVGFYSVGERWQRKTELTDTSDLWLMFHHGQDRHTQCK